MVKPKAIKIKSEKSRYNVGTFDQQIQIALNGRPPAILSEVFCQRLLQTFREKPELCRAFSIAVREGVAKANGGDHV